MGGKKKYIEMFGSFTEPFNYIVNEDNKVNISMVQFGGFK